MMPVKELKSLLRDDVYVEILDVLPSQIIIMPDSYKTLPVRGKVLATGPGRVSTKDGKLLPNDVMTGDIVHFHFGAVVDFYPDKKRGIVLAKNIQAVLTE